MRSILVSTLMCVCLLLPSAFGAEKYKPDIDRSIARDVPGEVLMEKYGKIPGGALTAADLAEMASNTFDGDTIKMLVILVDWYDRLSTYSKETFEEYVFSRNTWPAGSLADYIHEVSYGQVALDGMVYGWYTYDTKFSTQWGLWEMTDLLEVLDPEIDYSQFDGNGDGYVDVVCFVRSGNGEEDSGSPKDIWSVAWSFWPALVLDGISIDRLNTVPETWPLRDPEDPTEFLGVDTINRISVMAHETSHNLGLDDLYDYDAKLDTVTYFTPNDDNDHPLVDWCLMGYGGYGIMAIGKEIPTHLCGWSKMQLGWIEPIPLVGEFENLVIYNVETTNDSSLYKIPIDDEIGEYFLLEYRNPYSSAVFDKYDSDFSTYFFPDLTYGKDPLDRGLLITHVDESMGDGAMYPNNGTPAMEHYKVTVEDAGYNPARDLTTNPEGHLTDSAQWWYPYETRRAALFSDDVEGQNEFGPSTYPNSDSYYGPTGITVRVDSIVGDRMYVYVSTLGEVSCCEIRGDFDHSGQIDGMDIVYFVDWLWNGGPPPPCEEEADANGDEVVDAMDLVYLLDNIWNFGPAPVPCD